MQRSYATHTRFFLKSVTGAGSESDDHIFHVQNLLLSDFTLVQLEIAKLKSTLELCNYVEAF